MTEPEIKDSLAALLGAIRASDSQTVATEMARLDEAVQAPDTGLRPQLVHHLKNRSYAKALVLLGGETDVPVESCRCRKAAV